MVHGLTCAEMGLRRGLGGRGAVRGELGCRVHLTKMQMEGTALGGAVRLGDEWGWIPRRHLVLAPTGQAPAPGGGRSIRMNHNEGQTEGSGVLSRHV